MPPGVIPTVYAFPCGIGFSSGTIPEHFEAMLRERLKSERVRVVVRVTKSKGIILFGEAHLGDASADETRQRRIVEDTLRHRLESEPNVLVTAIDAIRRAPGWMVRAEVAPPHVPAPADIHTVEEAAAKSPGGNRSS